MLCWKNAWFTSVDNVVLVEIVYGIKDLSDCLRSILLRELAFITDAIEELSARREFGNDVVLVLRCTLRRYLCHRARVVPLTRTTRRT